MKRGVFLIFLCFSLLAKAQLSGFRPNESTRLVVDVPKQSKTKVVKNKPQTIVPVVDYVLYGNVGRRFSWIEGVGKPITQEEANRLPCYFRLSKKNDKGHWQHIQAMHGDSLTTRHDVNAYIIDARHDSSHNLREWRKRFSGICQWYITSDLSGENVVEERAYDKNGYMIYGFQPVKNGKNRVVAGFIDGYGRPVEIDEDSSRTYGNVVMVTYNRNGNDSIVDYFDGAGFRRRNNDGADQRRYEYDCQGRVVKKYSCNAAGDGMMDNWGICGRVRVYDANGRDFTETIVDTEWKPMRMPAKRAEYTDTFVSCRYKFDKWNRLVERTCVDGKGNPDSALNGVHRIEYIYSDTGDLISEKHYDLGNNLIKQKGEQHEKR